jgi:uncharacterized secreted protein with C-terminal beta-propeller domain
MENNKWKLTGIMIAGMIVVATFVYAVTVWPAVHGNYDFPVYELQNFDNYDEFNDFMATSMNQYNSYGSHVLGGWNKSFEDSRSFNEMATPTANLVEESLDFSETNVQVKGVDEPDLVKTDGTYLYILSNNKILIVKAYPSEDAEILSEIAFNNSLYLRNLFINQTRLVVFAESYNYPIYRENGEFEKEGYDEKYLIEPAIWYNSPDTHIVIFDLENISNPLEIKNIVVGGSYTGARMIGQYVYVVTTQYSYQPEVFDGEEPIIPRLLINGVSSEIPLNDIYYVDIPEKSSTITNVVSINVFDESEEVNAELFLLGNSETLYVSENNIYVIYSATYYDYDMLKELIDETVMPKLSSSAEDELSAVDALTLDDYQKQTIKEWIIQNYIESMNEEDLQSIALEIVKETERTIIHRIRISDGEIEYEAQGTIPGIIQNQFSLSEYEGHLRVSTTIYGWMARSYLSSFESENNIYVLNSTLNIVGSLENIATGEQIYATRFTEDKCYLVTYKQIDPFFVIDLSNPINPTILGELKIPGYSTYLHPYDEEHVIGIGRDEQEVKISLFDVAQLSNPTEMAKYEIQNNDEEWYWTQSSALYEHKAFLFDKEKNLLVIPVGDYSKESAYVFDISLSGGITLKGIIDHDMEIEEESEYPVWDSAYYKGNYGNSIKRTLYINDVIYTVSDNMVKLNDLNSLVELNTLELV